MKSYKEFINEAKDLDMSRARAALDAALRFNREGDEKRAKSRAKTFLTYAEKLKERKYKPMGWNTKSYFTNIFYLKSEETELMHKLAGRALS